MRLEFEEAVGKATEAFSDRLCFALPGVTPAQLKAAVMASLQEAIDQRLAMLAKVTPNQLLLLAVEHCPDSIYDLPFDFYKGYRIVEYAVDQLGGKEFAVLTLDGVLFKDGLPCCDAAMLWIDLNPGESCNQIQSDVSCNHAHV